MVGVVVEVVVVAVVVHGCSLLLVVCSWFVACCSLHCAG